MSKFKVGDEVRCIQQYRPNLEIGSHYIVASLRKDLAGYDTIRVVGGDFSYWRESRFELVAKPGPRLVPHKHAELIKAWADGVAIQYKNAAGAWQDCPYPAWSCDKEYRIKPEPKPDVVEYGFVRMCGHYDWLDQDKSSANVRMTFNGETGKLKSVELL